jgi:hypothetical protein
MPEQLHEADRIRAPDGGQRANRGNQALGDQTVKMRVKPAGIMYALGALAAEFPVKELCSQGPKSSFRLAAATTAMKAASLPHSRVLMCSSCRR